VKSEHSNLTALAGQTDASRLGKVPVRKWNVGRIPDFRFRRAFDIFGPLLN